MKGIHLVFPNNRTQPEFRQALVRAAKAGVQINYHSYQVEAESIKITGIVCDTERYRNAKDIEEYRQEADQ